MPILRLTALAALLATAAGCDLLGVDLGTDETEPTNDDPTQSDDTTSTNDTGTPDGCLDLCAEADRAGVPEGSCVSLELQGIGYNVLGAPYECAAIAGTETGCLACMAHLGVSDEDCVSVAATCL